MTAAELRDELAAMYQPWVDGVIADYIVERVVLDNLIGLPDYHLSDILRRDMAHMLLHQARRNEQSVAGLLVVGSGGDVVDIGRYKPLYAVLMSQWLERGWIRRAAGGGYELTVQFDD